MLFLGLFYKRAKTNKDKIICVKNHLEEKDSRLDSAIKTYERARLKANFVNEEYENFLATSVSFNFSFKRKGRKNDAYSSEIIRGVMNNMIIEQGRALELISTEDLLLGTLTGM